MVMLASQPRNPPFCKPNPDINLSGLQRLNHMASSGGKWDERCIEREILLREVKRRGEMLFKRSRQQDVVKLLDTDSPGT